METWKEKIANKLLLFVEYTGLEPIDFMAIILLPVLYMRIKKYFEEEKIDTSSKIYDGSIFMAAFVLYLLFFLNLFGIYSY